MRFEQPENLVITRTQEDVRPGGHIPDEHVKNMDIDGVDVSIIYPIVRGFAAVQRAGQRALNGDLQDLERLACRSPRTVPRAAEWHRHG